jgi:rhodanese-related sulfurtransferase
MRWLVVPSLLTFLLASACSKDPVPAASASPASGGASATETPGATARRLVASGAVLLDVRTPSEFADKHLPAAVNIPVEDLGARMADVEKLTQGDRTKPIVVYCRSGNRSRKAEGMLRQAGYAQITDIGTMSAYERLAAVS